MTDKQIEEKPDHYVEIGGLEIEPGAELAKADESVADEQQPKAELSPENEQNANSEASQANTSQDERDWEAEAKEMGWKPDGSRTAQEFVEYGERHKPGNYAKANYEKLERQLQYQEREFDQRLERLNNTFTTVLQRQEKQIRDQFAQQKRQAVEIGDTQTYERLGELEAEAIQSLEETKPKVEPATQAQPQTSVEFVTWKAKTGFDNWEPAKQRVAADILGDLMYQHPHIPQEQLIPALDASLERTFGEKAPRQQARKITDNGGRPSSGAKSTGFSSLPSEAQRGYTEIIDNGVKMSKEEYTKIYLAENPNV